MFESGFTDTFWLQWHLTDQCNLACKHCYRDPRMSRDERSLEELSDVLGRYARFLDKNNLRGRIQFCGGEPFLAKSLFPLIKKARELAIPCRVLSNGTVITKKLAEKLSRLGVTIVQVSLDGDQNLHDSLRGSGSFEKSVQGIRTLASQGIEVTVAATICRSNVKSIDSIVETASNSGAYRISFSRLVPQGSGKYFARDLLSPDGWHLAQIRMIEAARKHGIALMPRDPTFSLFHIKRRDFSGCSHKVSGCAAALNGMAIDTDGTVFPCRRMPIASGNVFDSDFDEIWQGEVFSNLRQREKLSGKCGSCGLKFLCGGCRAIAFAKCGDMHAEDPQCPLRATTIQRTALNLRHRWNQFLASG